MKFNLRAMFSKPTSVQEAIEKKDAAKLTALGCLAAAIILTILASLTKLDFLETLGMIFGVLGVVCFYFWYRTKHELNRYQTIFCECGEKYIYPDNVAYEITGEQISSGKDPKNDNIIRHTNTKVTLHCKCQKCKKERTIDTTFITERTVLNKRGVLLTTDTYPLEEKLVSFFKK